MDGFMAFVAWTILIIGMTLSFTEYQINSEEMSKLLNEVCSKNEGIDTTKITFYTWRFKCKDGASFMVERT